MTAFISPSGCGKSTLLRTLNRIIFALPSQRARRQEISINSVNVLGPKRDLNATRPGGHGVQKPTPFPMSIYDNIAFGVKLYEKLSKSDMDDRVSGR